MRQQDGAGNRFFQKKTVIVNGCAPGPTGDTRNCRLSLTSLWETIRLRIGYGLENAMILLPTKTFMVRGQKTCIPFWEGRRENLL